MNQVSVLSSSYKLSKRRPQRRVLMQRGPRASRLARAADVTRKPSHVLSRSRGDHDTEGNARVGLHSTTQWVEHTCLGGKWPPTKEAIAGV